MSEVKEKEEVKEKKEEKKELEIKIISGQGLSRADISGKSDPYVEIFVLYTSIKTKRQTKVIKKTLNAVWNETFKFSLKDEDTKTGVLYFRVFDKDNVDADDPLGVTKIPLSLLPFNNKVVLKTKLRNKHTILFRKEVGVINFSVHAKNFGFQKDTSIQMNKLKSLIINPEVITFTKHQKNISLLVEFEIMFAGKTPCTKGKTSTLKTIKSIPPNSTINFNNLRIVGKEDKSKMEQVVLNVHEDSLEDVLKITIYDAEVLKNKKLGTTHIPFSLIPNETPIQRTLPFYGKANTKKALTNSIQPKGEITLTLRAVGFGNRDL